MTLACDIADRVGAFSFDALPAEAVHWARIGILDTIGVTLAGAGEPCAAIVRRLVSSTGPALLLGTPRRVAAPDAAFANGTASHALDFDDASNTLGGHPSAPLVPALLALADGMEASGQAFLTAYVAGFETEARIARAVNFHHYDKGWHPTATLGTFGAAAAAARLLDLPPPQTATALAIAASLAAGLKVNFGTMTKPMHVGQCARNGVMAALLSREGFTASPEALEHRQGFFHVFNGEGNFDAAAVMRDWAAPLDIVRPGIAIKQYPCCGSTHPAIDAMLALVAEHALTPEAVERVVSWTHPRRLAHTNRPTPRSALDAKFSVQYCLARALADRQVVLSHFQGDAFAEPRIVQLMARIEAAPHPAMAPSSTEHFGAEVTVFTRDGRRFARKVDRALGRTAGNPLPRARLEAKFLDCAARVMDRRTAETLLDLLWRLDELPDLRHVSETIAAGTAAASVPSARPSAAMRH